MGEYCSGEINQNTVQNEVVGRLHSLTTALIGQMELKTLKCIYRKIHISLPSTTHTHAQCDRQRTLSLSRRAPVPFRRVKKKKKKKHLRGCRAAQCFHFHFTCHTKVQVLLSLPRPFLHMKNSSS